MNDIGFPPHVTHHEGKPGDERTKQLWELWAQVAEAEKRYRSVLKSQKQAASAAASASCEVSNAGSALRRAEESLHTAIGAPPEPERGEPE